MSLEGSHGCDRCNWCHADNVGTKPGSPFQHKKDCPTLTIKALSDALSDAMAGGPAGVPSLPTPARHEHEFTPYDVCRVCGQTEAAIEGCHHCGDDESVKNGRCWWCLKPLAASPPTPARSVVPVVPIWATIDALVEKGALDLEGAQELRQVIDGWKSALAGAVPASSPAETTLKPKLP